VLNTIDLVIRLEIVMHDDTADAAQHVSCAGGVCASITRSPNRDTFSGSQCKPRHPPGSPPCSVRSSAMAPTAAAFPPSAVQLESELDAHPAHLIQWKT
jgi:hypothetical protein